MRSYRWGCLIAVLLGAGVASAQEKPRVDALGDPLPAGAVARLGTIRFRPGGWISQLAFSPSGDQLACCATSGVTVYEAATGRELRYIPIPLPGFPAEVRAKALAWPGRSCAVVILELGHEKFFVWDIADPKATPPPIPRPTSGQVIYSNKDHERYNSFAVSPDGKYLAAGRLGRLPRQRRIDLLELTPGKWVHELNVVRPLGPHAGDCVGLAFRGDSKALLAFSHERGAAEEQLTIFDLATGEPQRRLAVPANAPRADLKHPDAFDNALDRPFALAPDGRTLALAAADGTVRVWDLAEGKEMRTAARHSGTSGKKAEAPRVRHLAFGAGGRRLLTSGNSRTYLWDPGTGRQLRALGPGPDTVFALAVSADGRHFATAGGEGQIRLWDGATGAGRSTVADYPDVDWSATAIAPDGRIAASAGTGGVVCLWDLADGRKLRRFERERKRAAYVRFTPDGRAALVGGAGAKMEFFDLTSGKPFPLPGKLGTAQAYHVGQSQDKRTLITFPKDAITLWDWPAGEPRRTFKLPGKPISIGHVHLSPDGGRLAFNAWYGDRETFEVWETATGRRLGQLEFPKFRGMRPVYSPDGSALLLEVANSVYGKPAAGGLLTEPELSLWNPLWLTRRHYFAVPPATNGDYGLQLGPVAFSPDGRTLALGLGNNPIALFETATGQVRRQLSGHRSYVHSLEFTPDGRRLLSTSADRTGLVWDVRPAAGAEPAGPAQAAPWDGLAEGDARKAYQAMARLAADPDRAVALLRARLQPAAQPDDAALDRLVADLDAKAFAVRDRAAAELDRLGHAVVPGVLARLPKAESLELRRRLEQFLDKHDRGVPPAEALRQRRAVEVLEHLGTPAARALLRDLAGGSPVVRLTQDAAASLRRLGE